MPELSFNAAGDVNVGGGVSGRDTVTATAAQADYTEKQLEQLALAIGKLQSDMVTVRLQIAAINERIVFQLAGFFVAIVMAGIAIIVAVVR